MVGHLEDIRPTGEERTGNIRVNTLPGWEEGDVAGHLIGHQFYGANYDRDNFVPMRRDVNHPNYYTLFEAKMATWMREQKRKHRAWLVQISIRAEYNDSRVGRQRMRPVSFSVAAVGITGHRAPSGAIVLTREPLARATIPNPRP